MPSPSCEGPPELRSQLIHRPIEILRRGDEVILRKKRANLREAFDLLAAMPDDYFAEGRQDPTPETREAPRMSPYLHPCFHTDSVEGVEHLGACAARLVVAHPTVVSVIGREGG